MKKVLFITLALAVTMTGFAQKGMERVKANQIKKVTADIYHRSYGKTLDAQVLNFAPNAGITATKGDDFAGWATMLTHYDLQSNGFNANRMWRYEDGSVGVVATWSQLANLTDRGTGYDYYDGTAFIYDEYDGEPMPGRVENEKTGWPSYSQYGPDGEIVVSHTSTNTKITYYTREKKGEGSWEGPNYIPNPDATLPQPQGHSAEMTWPRVITSGANHDIIHVLAADQDDEPNLGDTYLYYSRSTDGENWTTTMVPTLEEWEYTVYSSDQYALAANGDNVAILLLDGLMGHGLVIKSTDNGETWEKIKFWNNPYAGLDWATDPNSIFDEDNNMYGPEAGAICIDNDGIVHLALSSHSYYHAELGTSYTIQQAKFIDGIFYWNETMGTMVAPTWTCPDDGYVMEPNDHNVCRMWWPTAQVSDYITRNWEPENHLIGFIEPDEYYADIENSDIFSEQVYYQYFSGASTLPAIAVDDKGTVAVAYSSPDASRDKYTGTSGSYFYRSIYVTFIEPGYVIGDATGDYTDIPGNVYYNYVKLQDADDFLHSMDECVATCAAQNVTNNEFWFSYQADEEPGFFIGNNANQTNATDNIIWAQKVVPDYEGLNVGENPAVNPMTTTRIYPNPVVDQMTIEVNAAQASEMSISVYNLMGQKVMDKNVNINTGINTPTLNTSSLSSGVYFVTVKANGFENTMKFIVK